MSSSTTVAVTASAESSSSGHLQCLLHLRQLLLSYTCSNLLPSASPPVFLDQSFTLHSALSLLLSNGLSSAPLLDHSHLLSGSFSLSDALQVLCRFSPIATSPDSESVLSVSESRPSSSPPPGFSVQQQQPQLHPHPPHHHHYHQQHDTLRLPSHSLVATSHRPRPNLKSNSDFYDLPLSRLCELCPNILFPVVHLHPQTTLLDAGEHLCRSNHRRLPLIEVDPVTGRETLSRLVTPHTLLHFLATHPRSCLDRLSRSVGSLRIGSHFFVKQLSRAFIPPSFDLHSRGSGSLVAATDRHSVHELVRVFLQRSIDAIPIVDQAGGIIDVYELVDVIDLLTSPKSTHGVLDLTVRQAIALRSRKVTGITFCSPQDSLGTLLNYLAKNLVRMFVLVESEGACESAINRPTRTRKATKRSKVRDRLVGVITLPDLLDHLLACQSSTFLAPDYGTSAARSAMAPVYTSSLVSTSSKASSNSFYSPTSTLTSSVTHPTAHSFSCHPHTPLSLRMASSFQPSISINGSLPLNFNPPSSAASQPISRMVDLDVSSFSISRSQPLSDADRSHIRRSESGFSDFQQYRPSCLPASALKTPSKTASPPTTAPPTPPPMNKIAEFAAQMICYLWFAEPSTLLRSQPFQCVGSNDLSHMTRTGTTSKDQSSDSFSGLSNSQVSSFGISQAQLVPNPEFVVFVHNLLSTTQVSHSVVLLALFYIHRLKGLNPIKPNAKSEYRIGVVSLMLANKMLDDHTYTAKTWSEVSRLPLSSLNDGEIEFLQGLGFELHVNMRDFSAWFRLLHGMVHLKDRHTAAALAAGPRTRWFKKMRVVSGEGLSVLEGLVSPIRNSKMMKLEAEKMKKQSVHATTTPTILKPATRPSPNLAESSSQSANRDYHPAHPYNLRRSTRPFVSSSSSPATTPTHVLGWVRSEATRNPSGGCGPERTSVYAPSLPPGVLSLNTPHGMTRTSGQFHGGGGSATKIGAPVTQLSSRTTRMSMNGKRNFTQLGPNNNEADTRQTPAKRTTSSCASETREKMTDAPIRLPPIVLSHRQENPRYLGAAIIPTNPAAAAQVGTHLYFHSLAADKRAAGQPIRQEVNTTTTTANSLDPSSGVYVFGSEPWKRGTPMDVGQIGPSWKGYSNFSNAGLPGVIWAEGANHPPGSSKIFDRVSSGSSSGGLGGRGSGGSECCYFNEYQTGYNRLLIDLPGSAPDQFTSQHHQPVRF